MFCKTSIPPIPVYLGIVIIEYDKLQINLFCKRNLSQYSCLILFCSLKFPFEPFLFSLVAAGTLPDTAVVIQVLL